MRILIAAATHLEIQPLLRHFGCTEKSNQYTISLASNNQLDVLITGVGMVATAYQLGKLFATKKYDLVINAGIAGSFKSKYPIGTTIQVVKEYFSELGAESHRGFIPITEMGLNETNRVESTNTFPIQHLYTLPKGAGITVNKVHGNTDSIVEVEVQFDADVESMEGGAAMFVCHQEKLNFIEIRTISNRVEPRNKANWNIPLAITNLNKTLLAITNEF
jgi:futalosine hydrolase